MSQTSNKSLPKLNFHENAEVTDITVPWLYEAHSVLLLAFVLMVIFYFAFEFEGSIQNGIWLNMFFFLAVGCLVFPAGPFIRPHPIFWRLIFGISLLYSFLLLMLISLPPNEARLLLQKLFNDKSLGTPLKTRSYAVDCRLQFDVILSVLDRFIFAHFIGWAIKAMVVRDRLILWIFSILWELIELSTKYFIPNFAECWWDQLILDVLLCNGLGIEFGLFLASKFFSNTHKQWLGYDGPSYLNLICRKFKRFCIQFTPLSLTPMHWEPTYSVNRYLFVHSLIITVVCIDLNAFLLKLFLFIPTEHPLNVYRLVLMLFFNIISCNQYYLYITNERCKKMGSQVWLCFVVMILELVLSYKCAPSPFPSAPYINKVCWIIAAILWCIFSYVVMFRSFRHVHDD